MSGDASWTAWAFAAAPHAAMVALAVGALVALYRLARGPTRADRAVALDVIAFLLAGFLAALAIMEDEPLYLDVAIVVVVTSFLVTVAIARFLTRTRET